MSRRLEQHELERIRDLNGAGLNDKAIAERIGRGRSAVVMYRVRMGLPARPVYLDPVEVAKRNASIRRTFEREGRPHGNYAALANKCRAASIGWPDVGLMVACLLYVLADGPLETPEIQRRMTEVRTIRGWRPMAVRIQRVRKTLSTAGRSGLIDRLRKGCGGGRGGRPARSGLYGLSDLALDWRQRRLAPEKQTA